MTTKYLSDQASRKVYKHYVETSKEDLAKEGAVEDRSAISFAKVQEPAEPWAQALQGGQEDASSSEGSADQAREPTPEERAKEREQRRASYKEANAEYRKAMDLQKQAKEQINRAKHVQELIEQAKKDPTVLAKVLNLDPQEFYRQLTNKMLSIPDEPEKVDPQEEVNKRLRQYEEERRAERENYQNWQYSTNIKAYIANKIVPTISDTSKFELIHANGVEACAESIYDVMNAHYQQTGQELDPNEVAEEMERQLTKEHEEKIEAFKRIPKFAKHFLGNDVPGKNELPASSKRPELADNDLNVAEQLRSNKSGKLHHKLSPSLANPGSPGASFSSKKQAKLDALSKGIR